MKEQFILMYLSLLGVVIHSLFKVIDLQKEYKNANLDFSVLSDYFKKDWVSITISVLSCSAWFFLFAEVAAKYPAIEGFIRTSFFVMGMVGSYVCQKVLSNSKRYVRSVIDEKTNKADGKTSTDETT